MRLLKGVDGESSDEDLCFFATIPPFYSVSNAIPPSTRKTKKKRPLENVDCGGDMVVATRNGGLGKEALKHGRGAGGEEQWRREC